MKAIALSLFAAFTFALVGCEASGSVGHTDDSDSRTSYKKTTVEHPDGETTVKTETRHDTN